MAKKIFFYSNHREDDLSIGITKKVHAQIYELRKRGFEVFFSAYYNKGVGIFNNQNELIEHYKIKSFNNYFGHWYRRILNLKKTENYIRKNSFSILYMRFHFWDMYSLRLLDTAKKKEIKVIVEAHTYPYYVKKSKFSYKIIYFIDKLYAKKASDYIDLVAAITESDDCVWNCKTVKIENGVNIEDVKVRNVDKIDKNVFQIVCVANEVPLHGIPRIIYGLSKYSGSRNVVLALVGEYKKSTIELIKKLKLENKVIIKGKLFGEELYEVYEESSLGIGILAGYLADCHEGNVLKTKEYMACGIPFVTSASTTAQINNFKYAYVVPEDDSAINIDNLINFVDNLNFDAKDAEYMHNYAKNNYCWATQFDKILYYF